MLHEYETSFGQVRDLRAQRNTLVDQLDASGPEMERSLSEIMRSANADGDAAAAFGAGETLRSLLLARLYVTKFLSGNGQEDVDRVRSELADASKDGGQMVHLRQKPRRRTRGRREGSER